eukprot:scaffold9252_cov39-Isochrysis_galbana.AAC.1
MRGSKTLGGGGWRKGGSGRVALCPGSAPAALGLKENAGRGLDTSTRQLFLYADCWAALHSECVGVGEAIIVRRLVGSPSQ